jgi:hypothetical protein
MGAWTTIAAGLVGATPPTVLGIWSAFFAAKQARDQQRHDAEQRQLDRQHEVQRDRREHRARRYHTANTALGEGHDATKDLLRVMAQVAAADEDRRGATAAAYDEWFQKHVVLRAAAIASGDRELVAAMDRRSGAFAAFTTWHEGDGDYEEFAMVTHAMHEAVRARLVVLFAEV